MQPEDRERWLLPTLRSGQDRAGDDPSHGIWGTNTGQGPAIHFQIHRNLLELFGQKGAENKYEVQKCTSTGGWIQNQWQEAANANKKSAVEYVP